MWLPYVLLDGPVVVPLEVEVVSVLPEDLRQPVTVQVLALSQVYSHHKQVLLEKHLKQKTTTQRHVSLLNSIGLERESSLMPFKVCCAMLGLGGNNVFLSSCHSKQGEMIGGLQSVCVSVCVCVYLHALKCLEAPLV